jgi:predicted nucleic acid-binding protein
VRVTRFVIDAPTLVRIAREGHNVNSEHQLVAPSTIRSHALDLLLEAVRREEMTEREALEIHERITELKMRLLGDRVSRRAAWNLARQRGWKSVRQAEYLAVAQLQADALVAGDADLLEKAEGITELAPLGELVR